MTTPRFITCADEAHWHSERAKSLGGSDAPAVMGVSPHLSAFRVALTKMGKAPPQPPDESMLWGALFEPAIRDEYARRSGRRVDYHGKYVIVRSSEYPHMHDSLDGIIHAGGAKGPGVLQVKTTGSPACDFAPGTDLRLSYDVQVQHEMAVTGYTWASLAVLCANHGHSMHWYDVERNQRFIDLLARKELDFLEALKRGELPAVDGRPDTRRLLKHLHPRDNGKAVMLDAEAAITFEEWDAACQAKKEAEDKANKAHNTLIQAIGDNTFAVLPNGVRLSHRTQADERRVLRREFGGGKR